MKMPILDPRDAKAIYEEIREHAAQYLPEWNFGDEDDPGTVIAKIYTQLFEGTVQRYNKMPYKHFLFFLNLLGADRLSGNCAGGMATILLNAGTYPGVWVKKGSCLYKEGQERIVYETEENIYAVDNTLEAVYCSDEKRSHIVKPYKRTTETEEKPFTVFDFAAGENLQCLSLAFSEADVLHVPPETVVTLTFCHNKRPNLGSQAAQFLGDSHCGRWQYHTADGWMKIEKVKREGRSVSLFLPKGLQPTTYNEEKGCWLSYIAQRKGAETEIAFTDVLVESQAHGLSPDHLYANDRELSPANMYPFGERFSLYNDFYIQGDHVFSKRGAQVSLTITLEHAMVDAQNPVQPISPQWKSILSKAAIEQPEVPPLKIMQVQWEYWNGNGWARLFKDGCWDDLFRREEKEVQMEFICPEDIQQMTVGAYSGYWIRARIMGTNQLFGMIKQYCTPVIQQITMNYSYQGKPSPIKKLWIERDLEQKKVMSVGQEEIRLFEQEENSYPTLWFQLQNAMQGGPIKFYVKQFGEAADHPPALRWEYYTMQNGSKGWAEVKVVDETHSLSCSGSITFYFKHALEACRIFGTNGYWIRAVNTDKKYNRVAGKGRLPKIKKILLNTVKIQQQETRKTEYFYIGEGEKNKLCRLSAGNVTEYTVWVNEADRLLADERLNGLKDEGNVMIVRNPQGVVMEYWRKWEKVHSFASCDGQADVYRIDKINGKILFGDGVHGRIPPSSAQPSIRVEYRVSAGEKGNCEAGEITAFADAVPFVHTVYNAEPVQGGCDAETVAAAITRSAQMLRIQNRSVAKEDYAALAQGADRNVIRAKALLVSSAGEEKKNHIVIAVLPKHIHAGEQYFSGILRNIKKVLLQKAPLVLTAGEHIKIREVDYIEYSLTIDAVVQQMQDYQEVLSALERKLEEYLNPIHGKSGNGFSIGELPSKTNIYHYIKATNKLKGIENIYISCCEVVGGQRKEIDYETAISAYPFAVPINGRHEINIEVCQIE